MSRKKPKDFESESPPGWAQPREPLEEKHAPTLANSGAVYGLGRESVRALRSGLRARRWQIQLNVRYG
jgi:hypothetical protein